MLERNEVETTCTEYKSINLSLFEHYEKQDLHKVKWEEIKKVQQNSRRWKVWAGKFWND